MKLSFSLNVDELILLSMKVNEQSVQYKSIIRRKIYLSIFIFTAMALILYVSSTDLLMPLTVVITALILIPFYPTLQRMSLRRYFRRLYNAPENKIYLDKQTISLSKKGIAGEISKVKSFYPWTNALKLFENKTYFIIFLEGERGWLIPKKIFKKDTLTEFRKWFENIKTIRED